MEDNFECDYGMVILELLYALKEKVALILAVTILATVLGWGVSEYVLPHTYEASVNMIVNSSADQTNLVENDHLTTPKELVDTYAIVVKSSDVLNKVIDELQLDMSYEKLSNLITVNTIGSTQVIKITARCSDPAQARMILQTISEIAPNIVADIVENGSCRAISEPSGSSKPVSPNTSRNVLIAGALAFLSVCALVVLQELFRDYIVDDADLEKKLGISALGVIPDVED